MTARPSTPPFIAQPIPTHTENYVTTVQHLIEAGDKVHEEFLQWALANDLEEIAVVLKTHGVALSSLTSRKAAPSISLGLGCGLPLAPFVGW